MWKTIPLRLACRHAAVGSSLIAVLFIVVFTGGIAQRFGSYIGASSVAITVWTYAKWLGPDRVEVQACWSRCCIVRRRTSGKAGSGG